MDSDDPSGLPNNLQPLPDHDQARKGRGLGEAPHRCAGPEGHTGRAGRFPRRSLQHGPGPRPAGQSTAARAPRGRPRGARPSPSRPPPAPGPQRPGPRARSPGRPGPQPSPWARPNCLPGSSPPAPEGRRTWAEASSLPSKVKSSKSGLRQRL